MQCIEWGDTRSPAPGQVWAGNLDVHPKEFGALAALLAPDERMRAARYRDDSNRARFTVARARLRQLVGGVVGERANKIHFRYNAYGKPEMNNLAFSLTHAGHRWALALSSYRVGVDIERILPVDASLYLELASEEQAALHTVPHWDRTRAFFTIWTRKEAYAKALGRGLSIPLTDYAVGLHEPKLLRPAGCDDTSWRLASINVGDGFVGAVAEARAQDGFSSEIWRCSVGVMSPCCPEF